MEFKIDVFHTSTPVSSGLYSAQVNKGDSETVAAKTQIDEIGSLYGLATYEGSCTISHFEERAKEPEEAEKTGEEYNFQLEIDEDHRLSFVQSESVEERKTTMKRVDADEINFYIIGRKMYIQKVDTSYDPIFESLSVECSRVDLEGLNDGTKMEGMEGDPFTLDEDVGPEQEHRLADASGVTENPSSDPDVYRLDDSETVVVSGVEDLRSGVFEVRKKLDG